MLLMPSLRLVPAAPRARRRLAAALLLPLLLLASPAAAQTPPTTDLALWLRADQGAFSDAACSTPATDGGAVVCWADQSGNGLDTFIPPALVAPLFDSDGANGVAAVQFGGSTGLVTATSSLLDFTEATIFVVTDVGEVVQAPVAVAVPGTINNEYLIQGRDIVHHSSSGSFVTQPPPSSAPSSGLLVVTGVYGTAPTDLTNYVDGFISTQPASSVGSPSNYTAVNRAAYVGQRGDGRERLSGVVAEVLVYGRKLTDPERDQVTRYLGTKYAVPVLPVELTAFDARLDADGAARLTWQTASETNNAGFHVEHRAPDATAFAEAGFVDGAGTTTEAQTYAFRTGALAPGTHAFRLRQVDFDGTATRSATVELTVTAEAQVTTVWPNPVRGAARARVTVTQAGRVEAAVYDVLGRRVAVLHDGSATPGAPLALRLHAGDLPSGVYLLRVTTPSGLSTRRFTVVR
jgi:hypothetical protein